MDKTTIRRHLLAVQGLMKMYGGRLTIDSFGINLTNTAYMTRGLDEVVDEFVTNPEKKQEDSNRPFFGEMK